VIDRGPARECDVVIAFLQAEILSSRYSDEYILPLLHRSRLSREGLIDHPDLESESDNGIRRMLLQAYRGFGANTLLFRGFPADVVWRFVEIEPKDHQLLVFANEDNWKRLSEGSRSVEHLARRIARLEEVSDTANRVRAIQQDLADGKSMAPPILVGGENRKLILVEGHSRMTAYVGLNWQRNISALLGFSATMHNWHFY
jgi:hypothetical protein